LLADCGKPDSTIIVGDLDDLDDFDNCSTLQGSLYLYTSSDSEYDNITLPSTLQSLSGGLYCSGNGVDETTDSIEAEGLTNVASDPTDSSVGSVGFVIVDYPTLTLLSFPNLITVGSNFIIARNPKLTKLDFPSLKSVNGNIDITGSFQVVNMTSLTLVSGSINLQSSSASFVCPRFDNVTIRGTYACSIDVTDPQPLAADNSSTNPTPANAILATTTTGPSTSSVSSSIASKSTFNSASQNPSLSPTSSATGRSTASSASPSSFSGIPCEK
jgi:hypothetical protein